MLRVRPDLGWQSQVCVHDEYGRDFNNTPDDSFEPFEEYSYSSPAHSVDAGQCDAAAQFLKGSPLNRDTNVNYAAIYLIARSMAAFGRVQRNLVFGQRLYYSLMVCAFRYR